MELFLATRNQGKRRELERLMAEDFRDVKVWDFTDWEPTFASAIEDGDTFESNAFKKADHAMRQTGLISFAEDSGLVVDVLDGAPGVHSARYAGDDATDALNNQKLVESVKPFPLEGRTARFVSVICVCAPGEDPLYARGECDGLIVDAPRGDGGFGYDPYFLIPEFGKTTAEMTMEQKNAISHRGKSLRSIIKKLSSVDWFG